MSPPPRKIVTALGLIDNARTALDKITERLSGAGFVDAARTVDELAGDLSAACHILLAELDPRIPT